MTALKAHEVARYLARPDLSEGIFLAYGPDTGLVRETAQRLVQRFAGEGSSADIVVLDGDELNADPSRLAVEARTTSLFGSKPVIRVRGASKALVPTLTELKDDPGAAIVLEAGNLPPKDALRALVESSPKGRALPCYPDNDEALSGLIRETFSKAGIAIDSDVVPTLRDNLGNDREITRRELDKLVLFAAQSKRLSTEDVLRLCADNGALVIDEIIDSTGTGHAQKLEAALGRALANGVDAQRLLSTALIHFANLRSLRGEVDAGRSARDVMESMRPKPHFSRKSALEQQLRLWSDPALAEATERLQQAIADSRRKPALADSLVSRTLLALCMAAAQR